MLQKSLKEFKDAVRQEKIKEDFSKSEYHVTKGEKIRANRLQAQYARKATKTWNMINTLLERQSRGF
jgi:hypothetical protein